jgi:hypothetical protein
MFRLKSKPSSGIIVFKPKHVVIHVFNKVTLKHCCGRRIIVLISLLHAQQDALTQYKYVYRIMKMKRRPKSNKVV